MGVLNLAAGSIFVAIGQSGSKRSTQEGSAPAAAAEENEFSPEIIETFVDYYSYSAPFDIRVLEEMRSRCQSDPGCVADNAAL